MIEYYRRTGSESSQQMSGPKVEIVWHAPGGMLYIYKGIFASICSYCHIMPMLLLATCVLPVLDTTYSVKL